MKILTCKLCGATSESESFYARINQRCAKCHREMVKKNRRDKAEYYREYDAKRFKEDPRVLLRHKRYQATDAGKASLYASKRRWLADNPDKRAAHTILGNAVRDGRVVKPLSCEVCGCGGRIHGHHHDYTMPLDVKWLCPMCHTEEHREIDK